MNAKAKKFATQIDAETLEQLKAYAKTSGRSISSIVNDSVVEFLRREQVRPAFRSAMGEVLDEHAELLKRLAK